MGVNSGQNKRIKVKITNAEISNSFIKIKAQNVNSDEFIALLDLKSIFRSADDITNEDIQLGNHLYIARLDLDNYARCRIVEMNDYNSIANIDLIDSCCKIRINYNQLRLLPKSSRLYKVPSICNEYIIAELIVSKEYDDFRQKFIKFRELVVNNYLDIEFLSENRAGQYVQLYSIEASIVHDIVPNHPTLKSILKRIQLSEQMSLMLEQYNNESCNTSPERMQTLMESNDILNSSSIEQFPIGEEHEVRISSYIKGPKLFYVQSTKGLQRYQEFHINLQKIDLQPLTRRPKVSDVCLAFLDSNNVQRVEIMENNGNYFKVRLIDHGSEHVVKYKDLYLMPESVATEKPYAWKFSLYNVEKIIHLNIIEMPFYFQYITTSKRVKLVTKSGSVDTTAKCSIFDDTKDILDIIKAWDPRTIHYPKQIPLSNSHKVKIVFAESPKLFFVNVCDAINSHAELFEEFSNFNGCNYQIPTNNSACYVSVNNKNWRGNFERRISSSICKIKLVDIGISEDFSCKEIKVMIDKFAKIPPLAFKCCLVEYRNANFEKDILKSFIMKCKQQQTFNMNIIDYDGDIYYVSLENESEHNGNAETITNGCQNCNKIPTKEANIEQRPQTSSESIQTSPIFEKPPSPIYQDWTYDERKEFGDKTSWEESSIENSFQSFDCNGIIASSISPNDFTIQCTETLPEIQKLLADLQISAPNECPLTEFTVGSPCIAMIPLTKKWCRAVILDGVINDENTLITLRDIDGGEMFVVDNVNLLKRRSLILLFKPSFGIRCGLPVNIKINQDDEALRLFLEMTNNKEIRYKIIGVNKYINFCDILVDNKSVTDSLVELDVAVKLKYVPNDAVYVPFIKNLNEFYVHLENESQLVKNINRYAEIYQKIDLKAPIEGITIMAKSKKFNKWYRAKILSINHEEIKVKYIDFGDTEMLTLDDIGMMDEHCFLKQSPLAHRCSFNLPTDLNPDSPKAIEEFKRIAKNGYNKLFLRMIEPKLKRSVVELHFEDTTNVLVNLVDLCDKLEIKELSIMDDSKICNSTASSESSLK